MYCCVCSLKCMVMVSKFLCKNICRRFKYNYTIYQKSVGTFHIGPNLTSHRNGANEPLSYHAYGTYHCISEFSALIHWSQGLYSLSGQISYRKISCLEAARFGVRLNKWQTSRQRCCRDACHISEWYDNNNTQSCDFETSRDLTVRRLTAWWIEVLALHVRYTPRTLRWRHNGRDSVSNHQPHDCLLNRLFRRRTKKPSKLSVTGLCVGNSLGTSYKWPVTRKMFPIDDVIMKYAQGSLFPVFYMG